MSDFISAPASWRKVPLQRLFQRREVRGRADLPLLSVYRDWGIVQRAGRDDNYNKPGEDLDSYKHVQKGDLVLNKMKTWQGSLGISDYEGIVSPAYFVAKPIVPVNFRFIHHLLRSLPMIAEYGSRSKGIRPSQWDLPWEEFSNISVALPAEREQRAIADFLDAETARIDALIEKKRRLKQLLATRLETLARSLIFDQSDTKKARLGRIVSILPGYAFSSPDFRSDEENAVRLLRGINVAPGRCRWEEVAYLPKTQAQQHQTYMLSPGDLVLGMDRPFISEGTRLATIKETDVPSLLVQRVARIRAKEALNPKYLSFALHSDLFKDHCTPITTGVSVPHISADQIADFRVPLPARNAQNVIAERLTNEETRTDALRNQISRQIELLTEHRQALITAAVTGRLDVAVS